MVGLALFGASVVMTDPLDDRRDASAAQRDELTLLQVRTDLARSHRDELTHRLVAPLAPRIPLTAPGDDHLDAVAAASIERLDQLAERDGSTALAAAGLRSALADWSIYESLPSDELWDLMFITDMARYESVAPTPFEGFEQLAFYDVDVTEILHEMAALQYDAVGTDDPLIRDVAESISPAWFAPDFAQSGTTSEFGGPSVEANIEFYGWEREAAPDARELHTTITAMIESTPVADYYRNLEQVLADVQVHSPTEFQRYATALIQLNNDVRRVIDTELEARDSIITSEEVAIDDRTRLVSGLRALGLLIAAAAGGATIVRLVRTSRAAARQMMRDPLTGLGNRRALETTQRHLDDPHHEVHVVTVIDLDRFKLVNDTHGHGVGDELLVRLGRGLESIVRTMAPDASTVVRQGGDEFLLSLHDAESIDDAALRSHLNDLRSSVVTLGDSIDVELAFSYGLITAWGPQDLVSIMRTADLAAYEDKAARRTPTTAVQFDPAA